MNIYSLWMGLFSFGTLLIGFFCYWRCRAGFAINFLIFSIVTSGWAGFWALWSTQQFNINETLLLIKAGYSFAVFIPITFFHFVVRFLEIEKFPNRFFYWGYSLTALLIPIIFGNSFVPGIHSIPELKFFPLAGPSCFLFTIDFLILTSASFYLLFKTLPYADGKEYQQLKYLIVTSLLCFICGGLTFLPVYKIYFPLAVIAPMPFYPFLIGMALMKFDLFNTEEFVQMARKDKLAAVGILAASINHEIRNPLYIIQGLTQSHFSNLEKGIYSGIETALEKSNQIHIKTEEQASRAIDIMKRFSKFAHFRKEESSKEPVDLNQVIQNVLLFVGYEFNSEKISLVYEEVKDISKIRGNSGEIEEVLFNLVINARQALNGIANPELKIKTEEKDKSVFIYISDNGPGIDRAQLKRIFQPFYTTKKEGTGLGLYITKQLTERNGGSIKVESFLSKGTIFRLEFKI